MAEPPGPPQPACERRPRLDPDTAEIRNALRAALGAAEAHTVILAVSGGADSMALATTAAFLQRRGELEATAVIVDHGLQRDAARAAERAREQLEERGLRTRVRTVEVDREAPEGLEAAARAARYSALEEARTESCAEAVLLGHTLDDQAETVLLGLARGAGARTLAAMSPRRGRLLRPLLGVRRAQTEASCRAQGIEVWHDPMNADDAFTRVRVRRHVLPVLTEQLGPGIESALARTAAQLRADADYLEAEARRASALIDARVPGRLPGSGVRTLPEALRTRVLRRWLIDRIGRAQDLSYQHVREVEALLLGDRSGEVSLPGGARARAEGGDVVLLAGKRTGDT